MTKVPDWVVQTAELGEAFELCVHKDEGCGQAFDKITPGVLPFSQLRLQFASAHTSRSTTVTPWQGTGIDLLLHIAVAGAASSQASPEAGSWMRLHIGLRMTQERLVVSSVVCFECLRSSLNGDYARLRRHPLSTFPSPVLLSCSATGLQYLLNAGSITLSSSTLGLWSKGWVPCSGEAITVSQDSRQQADSRVRVGFYIVFGWRKICVLHSAFFLLYCMPISPLFLADRIMKAFRLYIIFVCQLFQELWPHGDRTFWMYREALS